jgi:hypothetical protein
MLTLWLIVFPASWVLAQGLAYLPLTAAHAVLLRSGLLTAILIIAMDLLVVPCLQRLMNRVFSC